MPVAEDDGSSSRNHRKGTGTKDTFSCGNDWMHFFAQFFEVSRQLFSNESQCKDAFSELRSITLNFI
jgi:hypothetical protein